MTAVTSGDGVNGLVVESGGRAEVWDFRNWATSASSSTILERKKEQLAKGSWAMNKKKPTSFLGHPCEFAQHQ